MRSVILGMSGVKSVRWEECKVGRLVEGLQATGLMGS